MKSLKIEYVFRKKKNLKLCKFCSREILINMNFVISVLYVYCLHNS